MQLMIPSTKCLFEVVDGFTQFTDMVGFVSVSESLWLLHEHVFEESVLKKCIVDI